MVVILLLLTLLAHLLVIEWLKRELQAIAPGDEDDEPVISITMPPPSERIPPPKPPAPPPDDSRKAVAAVPKAEPAAEVAEPVPPAPSETALAGTGVAGDAVTAATGSNEDVSEPAVVPTVANSLFERVSPPPPAELSFDAIGIRNDGRRIEGKGTIVWSHDGQRYTLNTEVGVLLFTLLKYRSDGDLGKLGIAPQLYAEKRIGRSETNTHFQRAANVISFSASTATVPVKGGEQDRGSWVWQLASLGRGDPEKFEAGLVLEMPVAGTKTVDTWRIYVNERENIAIPGGDVSAWRLSVIPGATSFDRQVDVWLAPDREWYPVRMSHQDKNGNRIELLLTKISTR
jgi:hypothetical protein